MQWIDRDGFECGVEGFGGWLGEKDGVRVLVSGDVVMGFGW